MRRIAALVAKDFAELRQSPGIFIPALITGAASTRKAPSRRSSSSRRWRCSSA